MGGKSLEEDITAIQSIMGISPQDHVFFPELSGRQHVFFWATFKKCSLTPNFARDLLLKVGLGAECHDELVRTYSGGMQRKLCLACSVIGDPRIVLLDEPTTGLDPVSRRHVWDFIVELKRGRIVILTTHSMEEADALSDTVTIMSSGKVKVLGTPLALKHKYGTGFFIRLGKSADNSCISNNRNDFGGYQTLCNQYTGNSLLNNHGSRDIVTVVL